MEFQDLKIGETYVHGNMIFTKKDKSYGVTPSGITFFMNAKDKVELYKEVNHNDSH